MGIEIWYLSWVATILCLLFRYNFAVFSCILCFKVYCFFVTYNRCLSIYHLSMDALFKILSDRNRRRIIQLLKQKEMTVTDLLTHFDITQASLSHHLTILKSADLVLDERRWQFIYYSLNQPVFEEKVHMILNLLV